MSRAGVVGRKEAQRIAPWIRLPEVSSGQIEVLYAVVRPRDVTIERYIFGVPVDDMRSIALLGYLGFGQDAPNGQDVGWDDRHVYWPPVDVVEAALYQARGGEAAKLHESRLAWQAVPEKDRADLLAYMREEGKLARKGELWGQGNRERAIARANRAAAALLDLLGGVS